MKLSKLAKRLYSKDTKYINNTIIPTYHFQKSLPKLPVPKLEKTLEKYLYFSEPLLNEDEYNNTKKIVKEFGDGIGKELQDKLILNNKQQNKIL